MFKCWKKLVSTFLIFICFSLVSTGFYQYLSLDWSLNPSIRPIVSAFNEFKHIKYPRILAYLKNKNSISLGERELNRESIALKKQIIKIYNSASSLFYLNYLPIEPVEKDFGPIDPIELSQKLNIEEPSFSTINTDPKALSLFSRFKLEPIKIEPVANTVNWSSLYDEVGLEAEILAYEDFDENKTKLAMNMESTEGDLIKLVQSATERSSQESLDNHENEKDDLVFFSYKKEEEENKLSSTVLQAIQREFNLKKNPRVAQGRAGKTVGGYTVTTPEQERDVINYKAKKDLLETEVVTIGVRLDKDIIEQVSNIEFVPHYDKNERIYDEAEGVIRLNSNSESSNYIYGTFLGKDFVNTRTSIPLYLGGGVFDVPLLEKEAFNKLLDKEELRGEGSHLLIDLGEGGLDVDIDKPFEARSFLDSDFKITSTEKSYRYVLYVGVEPGNVVVRYLDDLGNTLEKLSFLADREVTFEYFSRNEPYDFSFETFELSPLSKKAKELPMGSANISLFARQANPVQVGLNSFKYDNHISLSSSNSYLEFSHLGDAIFAGMRFSNYVILPTASFIDSILKAENLDNLENHCMIQLNFSDKVKEILYDGEDRLGPMEVKLKYLDEDGILSEEPSLLTRHAFFLGTGQGVINMQIHFLSGKKLVAQSFCSEGTYLVEQL